MGEEDVQQTIFGINPVLEALERGLGFQKVSLLKGRKDERFERIISLCKESGIQFRFEEEPYFDQNAAGEVHQGVVGILKGGSPVVADLEDHLTKLGKDARVLILDRVTDPHNVGAVARSAWFFGCNLIITEKKYSAPLEATVHKVSSGASLLVSFHRADHLADAMETLKQAGFTLYAADNEEKSSPVQGYPLQFPLAFVLGSEGTGLRSHVSRHCHAPLRIAGSGGFDSLNVSNAAAVFLYEASRQLSSKAV